MPAVPLFCLPRRQRDRPFMWRSGWVAECGFFVAALDAFVAVAESVAVETHRISLADGAARGVEQGFDLST